MGDVFAITTHAGITSIKDGMIAEVGPVKPVPVLPRVLEMLRSSHQIRLALTGWVPLYPHSF